MTYLAIKLHSYEKNKFNLCFYQNSETEERIRHASGTNH